MSDDKEKTVDGGKKNPFANDPPSGTGESNKAENEFTQPIVQSDENEKRKSDGDKQSQSNPSPKAFTPDILESLSAERRVKLESVARDAKPGECVIVVGDEKQAQYVSTVLHNMGRDTSVRIVPGRDVPVWRVIADDKILKADGLKVI